MNTSSVPQPDFVKLENYDDIKQIKTTFPSLSEINEDAHVLNGGSFFVIRVHGLDNIHRAMKYGVWTRYQSYSLIKKFNSSSRKNEKLSQAWKNGDVYLFFTKIKSSCFSGVAKLVSDFDPKGHFKLWVDENKWFGSFKIKWLFVKDIGFSQFSQLSQMQMDNNGENLKKVYELMDCSQLETQIGEKMFEIFKSQSVEKTVFEDFTTLDLYEVINHVIRRIQQEQTRSERLGNNDFEKQFNELSRAYEQMPFSFSIASYQRKKMQRNPYYYNQQMMQYPYMMPQQYPYYYGNCVSSYIIQDQGQNYWNENNGFYQRQQRDEEDDQSQPIEDRYQIVPKKYKKKLAKK